MTAPAPRHTRLHGSARGPSGLRRTAGRAGGVQRSVYFEVCEASGIGAWPERSKVRWSQLKVGRGGVRRHGGPGGADLPVDRKPQHLRTQRDRAHLHGGRRGHDREHSGAAQWHSGRRGPGDQAVGIERPQTGRGVRAGDPGEVHAGHSGRLHRRRHRRQSAGQQIHRHHQRAERHARSSPAPNCAACRRRTSPN